jgi:hypothetical protein
MRTPPCGELRQVISITFLADLFDPPEALETIDAFDTFKMFPERGLEATGPAFEEPGV